MTHISFPAQLDFGEAGNLGKNLNDSCVIINSRGYPTIAFRCDVPTGGEITFEITHDGINWEAIDMRSFSTDVLQKSTTIAGDFIGSIGAAQAFRLRTSAAGSADGTVRGRSQRGVSVIETIEVGAAAHKFGFKPIYKDVHFSSAQTATTIWTPATGKKFVVTDLCMVFGGTTDATVTIFDEINVSEKRIFTGDIDVSNNRQSSVNRSYSTPFVASDINNSLKITTSAAITIDVNVHGYEI